MAASESEYAKLVIVVVLRSPNAMAQVHAAAASQTMLYASSASERSRTTRYIPKGAFPFIFKQSSLPCHYSSIIPVPLSNLITSRYVEMLENQQSQLVAGLQELYKRVQSGQGWAGSPLKETSHGGPLTHDILERLGALKQENHSDGDRFEEDLSVMQQRLLSNGAGYMQRSNSTDSDSETEQSPIFEQMPPRRPELINPFAPNRFPPTPPTTSPYMRSASTSSAPGHLRFSPQSITPQSAMNPALLQRPTWSQPSQQQVLAFDDNMDFINRFEMMPQMEGFSPQVFQQNMNACLPTRDWQEESEDFSKYLNGTMAV
jgi:hypothetical protein